MPSNWPVLAIFVLVGFIVGWGLEFALDMLFWRRADRRRVAQDSLQANTFPAARAPGKRGQQYQEALSTLSGFLTERAGTDAGGRLAAIEQQRQSVLNEREK